MGDHLCSEAGGTQEQCEKHRETGGHHEFLSVRLTEEKCPGEIGIQPFIAEGQQYDSEIIK